MLTALLAAIALVFTGIPAGGAEAASAPTKTTVTTSKDLAKALSSGQFKTVTFESATKKTVTIPEGDYSKIAVVFNAPNAKIVNNGLFKKVVLNDVKKFSEYAKGNTISARDEKTAIAIAKGAEVKKLAVTKKGAELKISNKGDIEALTVSKQADSVQITQKGAGTIAEVVLNAVTTVLELLGASNAQTEVTVNKAAAGSAVTAAVAVSVEVKADVDVQLKAGAEDSVVAVKSETAEVKVDNATKEEVIVEDASGNKTEVDSGKEASVEAGKVEEIKDGSGIDNADTGKSDAGSTETGSTGNGNSGTGSAEGGAADTGTNGNGATDSGKTDIGSTGTGSTDATGGGSNGGGTAGGSTGGGSSAGSTGTGSNGGGTGSGSTDGSNTGTDSNGGSTGTTDGGNTGTGTTTGGTTTGGTTTGGSGTTPTSFTVTLNPVTKGTGTYTVYYVTPNGETKKLEDVKNTVEAGCDLWIDAIITEGRTRATVKCNGVEIQRDPDFGCHMIKNISSDISITVEFEKDQGQSGSGTSTSGSGTSTSGSGTATGGSGEPATETPARVQVTLNPVTNSIGKYSVLYRKSDGGFEELKKTLNYLDSGVDLYINVMPHTNTRTTVKSNGVELQRDPSGAYIIRNISSDISITVEFTAIVQQTENVPEYTVHYAVTSGSGEFEVRAGYRSSGGLQGGQVDDGETVKSGMTLIVFPKAAEGYHVASVKNNGSELTVEPYAGGQGKTFYQYVFENVTGDVNITVAFEKDQEQGESSSSGSSTSGTSTPGSGVITLNFDTSEIDVVLVASNGSIVVVSCQALGINNAEIPDTPTEVYTVTDSRTATAAASNGANVSISYSSSDPGLIVVDESTGEITIKNNNVNKAVRITAKASADGCADVEKTYIIKYRVYLDQ